LRPLVLGSKDVIYVSDDLASRCMWFYVFFMLLI